MPRARCARRRRADCALDLGADPHDDAPTARPPPWPVWSPCPFLSRPPCASSCCSAPPRRTCQALCPILDPRSSACTAEQRPAGIPCTPPRLSIFDALPGTADHRRRVRVRPSPPNKRCRERESEWPPGNRCQAFLSQPSRRTRAAFPILRFRHPRLGFTSVSAHAVARENTAPVPSVRLVIRSSMTRFLHPRPRNPPSVLRRILVLPRARGGRSNASHPGVLPTGLTPCNLPWNTAQALHSCASLPLCFPSTASRTRRARARPFSTTRYAPSWRGAWRRGEDQVARERVSRLSSPPAPPMSAHAARPSLRHPVARPTALLCSITRAHEQLSAAPKQTCSLLLSTQCQAPPRPGPPRARERMPPCRLVRNSPPCGPPLGTTGRHALRSSTTSCYPRTRPLQR